MPEPLPPALKAVSDAVLAVASQLSVEEVLQRLVDSARELACARYAALGIPDGGGGFRRFLVSGMSDELVTAMGPLPRTHGMLGAMLEAAAPIRTEDIHTDPRFRGWWPRAHPDMRSFLGVPIVAADGVIGAFYLTEKQGAPAFDEADEELIELLAAHAAIAITNARLYERSRELSILVGTQPARARAARRRQPEAVQPEPHRRGRATLLERDPDEARAQLERVSELAREALGELRSLILGLRPAELERDGLAGALRKEIAMLERRPRRRDRARGRRRAPTERLERRRARDADRARGAAQRRPPRESVARHGVARGRRRRRDDGVEVTDDGMGFEPERPELRSAISA